MEPEQHCPTVDRRVNVCPLAEKVAEAAAEKAVADVFAKLGFNVHKPEDQKKLVILFDLLETINNNSGRVKISVLVTFVSMSVVGIGTLIWKTITVVTK